ncbi:MAG: PHP domain-containing protein, partial [Planctomycetes bacterium]|nr:PHP domain-containing protein [Planctomycetota bacterium]
MQNGRDYHIHTHYMKCGVAAMTIEAVYRRCEEVGLRSIAITDHLNRREQAPTHLNIRKDMAATPTKMETFFGVE